MSGQPGQGHFLICITGDTVRNSKAYSAFTPAARMTFAHFSV
jgi:hypothetical protein